MNMKNMKQVLNRETDIERRIYKVNTGVDSRCTVIKKAENIPNL